MTNEAWINLPVKDVSRSRKFYIDIGFKANPIHPDRQDLAGFRIGEKEVALMLFPEDKFMEFTNTDLPEPVSRASSLYSFDAESPQEVDEIINKVKAAGGTVFSEPAEKDGWMYGAGFIDPDGHYWNALYMDMEKMPKG